MSSANFEENDVSALGSFADVWEARQDSDILLEDALGTKAATDIFVAHEEGMQQQLGFTEVHQPIKAFCHNPYSLTQPLTELVVCMCDTCTSPATTPRASFEGGLSTDYMSAPMAAYSDEDNLNLMQYDDVVPMPQAATPPLSIRFMPPPPPRMDTCDVLYACGAMDADAVVYNIMTRWYAKVVQVQQNYLPEEDCCPEPCPEEFSFGEWCAKANEWWTRHFANMQKKVTTPQRRSHGYEQPKYVARSPRHLQQQRHLGYW